MIYRTTQMASSRPLHHVVRFGCRSDNCDELTGHLYLPDGHPPPAAGYPTVVLAHGLCCLQSFEPIPTMVAALLRVRIACFTFDYHGFGESWRDPGRPPPQLAAPAQHCRDWEAAVKFAAGCDGVDRHRMALWGTSFSGGHVLITAANCAKAAAAGRASGWDLTIKSLVSQVGCMQFTASRIPVGLRSTQFVWQYLRSVILRKPIDIKLCGLPGERAISVGRPEHDEILALTRTKPAEVPWRNATPVESMFRSRSYRPLDYAGAVPHRVLFVAAENDRVTPAELVRQAAALAPNSEYHEVAGCGHSEIYFGTVKDEIAQLEVAFFLRNFTDPDGSSDPPPKTARTSYVFHSLTHV